MDLYFEIKKRLNGFNLNIKIDGSVERVGLLGASGSGKSMALRCIAGLVTPDEGKIIVNGRTFFDSNKGINVKPIDRKVGFVFQNYALFPHLTVSENVAFGIMGLSPNEKAAKIRNMIDKFHLAGLEGRYPHEISGGQQQRTALARAVAPGPEILLLDEPFSALDDHLRMHMTKEMLEFLKDFKGTTMFVTHNMEEAYRLCETLAVLNAGEVHAFGLKKDVFENPPTIETARITGCKNIARAIRVDDKYIKIPSWNINLKTNSKSNAKNGFCAIRANHIKLCEGNYRDKDIKDIKDNVLKAKIVESMETPFRQTVYLKFEEGAGEDANYHVQWEVTNDIRDKIMKNPQELYVVLPEEKIMYF